VDNRTNGGRFEQDLSHKLAEAGFWVHVLQQNKSGQPADIIAVKGHFHTLIDCKVVSDDKGFPFDRIEENQKFAMRMFHRKCCESCYFSIRLPDESVWMVSLERLENLRGTGRKRLTEREIRTKTWPLDRWLESSDIWSENL